MKFLKTNPFRFVLIAIGTVILLELFLQFLFLLLVKRPAIPMEINDARLGARPNPEYPDHDQKGFRNKVVPREVEIIAMGDSQTYGMGVLPAQAWPQQLEAIAKIKTYNMAFGGYGPAHSLLLLDEALELKPKVIIEAFYSGNDLFDSYSLVYETKQLTALKTSDQRISKAILEAENAKPLKPEIQRLFYMGRNNKKGIYNSIITNSKIYFLGWMCRELLKQKVSLWDSIKQYALKHKDYCEYFESGRFKTLFTPDYRFCAVNLGDPRISEGHRIALESITLLKNKLTALNIGFIVLLMPTKELVFKDIVYQPSASYNVLIQNEELLWQRTKDFLGSQSVDFIDALPALRKCLETGVQPYYITGDGHPNAIGHRAIALLAQDEMTRRGLNRGGKN